jgi:hypothetical protein
MSKSQWEEALQAPLTDAEYAKLAGLPPPLLPNVPIVQTPPSVATNDNAHAGASIPSPADDLSYLIAPKPEAPIVPPPPKPPPMTWQQAKSSGLKQFLANPEAYPSGQASAEPTTSIKAMGTEALKATASPGGMAAYMGAPKPAAPVVGSPIGDYGKNKFELAAEKKTVEHMANQADFQAQINELEVEKSAKALKLIDKQIEDAQTREDEAKVRAARRKYALDKFEAESSAALDDYVKSEIDPSRYWESKSTGGKIASILGLALGAFGSALQAKAGISAPNQAMDMLQNAMKQDIDIQKANIAKKGAGLEARKGLYTQMLQKFGSEDAAEAMTLEAGMRRAIADTEALAAKYDNKELRVRADALIEAAYNKIDMYKLGRADAGVKMKDAVDAAKARAAAAAQAAAMKPYKDEYESGLKITTAKGPDTGGLPKFLPYGTILPDGTRVTNPYGMHVLRDANNNIIDYGKGGADGTAGKGLTPVATISSFNEKGQPVYGQGVVPKEQAKDFNQAQKDYAAIKGDIKIIKDLREKHGGGAIWSPDDEAKANAAAARIQLMLKSESLFHLGVIAGPDKDYLASQLPDKPLEVKAAGALGYDPIGKGIESVESFLDERYKNAEATYVQGAAPKNSGIPLTKPNK